MRLPALTLLLAGCLSRPTGLPDDAGVDAVSPNWPVPGVSVGRTLARDLDGDGDLELVVASVADDDAVRGVYVLPGGPGFGAAYTTFVATALQPWAIDVADLGGSDAPELAVFGQAGAIGRVLIHEGAGALAFATTAWAKDFPGTEPLLDDSNGVWLLDSDGDGAVNVLAADANELHVGEPAGFDEQAVFDMPLVQAEGSNSTFFQGIVDLFVLPAGAGRADLVVDDHFRVSIFRGDGTDTYPAARREDLDVTTNHHDVATHLDLDGDGTPEILGAQDGGFLGGNSVAGAGGGLDYAGTSPANHPVMTYLAARAGRLDDDPSDRPDWLLLDHFGDAQPPDTAELVLVRDLVASPGTLTATNPVLIEWQMPGRFVAVEAGDFDGDGEAEIVLLDDAGAITCLAIGDNVLVGC